MNESEQIALDFVDYKSLCIGENCREEIGRRPWRVEIDGREWSFASDGWIALFVEVRANDDHPPEEVLKKITNSYGTPGEKICDTHTSMLKRWAGQYLPPIYGNCENCECEFDVEPDERIGLIGDIYVNKNRLAKVLQLLPYSFVEAYRTTHLVRRYTGSSEESQSLLVRSPHWMFVLCNMHFPNGCDEEFDVFDS